MGDQILDLNHDTELGDIAERAVVASIDDSGITEADPAVIDAAGHDFLAGDLLAISGAGGMTEINGLFITVASVNAGVDITTDLDTSSGFTTHTSGGILTLVHAVTNEVRVSYDDAKTKSEIVDALTRAREKVIELSVGV